VLAGHEQGALISAGGNVDNIGRYGSLLGVFTPVVDVHSLTVEPGDLVVFHTDGVTDAPIAEALPRDELIKLIAEMRDSPLDEIGRRVRETLDQRRPRGDRDDTALLLLRRR
jgi:serine phosphatase RsbU (regulator of sigma subunit)